MNGFLLGPGSASTFAPRYDALFYALLGLTCTVAFGIFLVILWYCIKYRAGSPADRHVSADDAQRDTRGIELAWTLTPLVIFIGIFVWAAWLYLRAVTPPDNALPVYVVAKQWMWKLEHPAGRQEINELHVPRGVPVKLVMTSQDVIHSFFVPAFRIKQDVLPGRYVTLWFEATRNGEFHLFCAEFCGTDHSQMTGKVVVMEPPDFQRWLAVGTSQSLATRGEAKFSAFGCAGCHSAGASVRAPLLEGLAGRPVRLADGSTVLADARYLRDSILLPNKEIVAGYAAIMPSYTGQIDEDGILELNAYITSLAEEGRRQP
jgi:cytochrome c oxidase subunit 2